MRRIALALSLALAPLAVAAGPSSIDPERGYYVSWRGECSRALDACVAVASNAVLRRSFASGAGWSLAFALGPSRVPEAQTIEARVEPDGPSFRFERGRDWRPQGLPGHAALIDPDGASAFLAAIADPARKSFRLTATRSDGGRIVDAEVDLRNLPGALAWIDGQQGRADRDRRAVTPPADREMTADEQEDWAAFQGERTLADLPQGVRRLHAREKSCRGKPPEESETSWFDALRLDTRTAGFVVFCRHDGINLVHRAYVATMPGFRDPRPIDVPLWRGNAPKSSRDIVGYVAFAPNLARLSVWSSGRREPNLCSTEQELRWIGGGFRLIEASHAPCPKGRAKPDGKPAPIVFEEPLQRR